MITSAYYAHALRHQIDRQLLLCTPQLLSLCSPATPAFQLTCCNLQQDIGLLGGQISSYLVRFQPVWSPGRTWHRAVRCLLAAGHFISARSCIPCYTRNLQHRMLHTLVANDTGSRSCQPMASWPQRKFASAQIAHISDDSVPVHLLPHADSGSQSGRLQRSKLL